jgi:hypothetical protein
MNTWVFLYIYLAGAALVGLRIGWHIRYRLDKYDRIFCNVRSTFWFDVILWPLLLLKLESLINPKFSESFLHEGRAEAERELDRLEANLPQCTAFIRYVPERDESGECDSQFVFDTAEVLAIMEKRLAELPTGEHGRYPGILDWLCRRDVARLDPVDVPAPWNGRFLNVAIGMMNRGLGQVRCGTCGEIIPQDRISVDSGPMNMVTSGWAFNVWRCPQGHKLLTKDAMHFFIRKAE